MRAFTQILALAVFSLNACWASDVNSEEKWIGLTAGPPVLEQVQRADSDPSSEIKKYLFMGPAFGAAFLARNLREKGLKEGGESWAKDESKYSIGYFAAAYALHRFSNAFLFIDQKEFDEKTNAQMRRDPKKVLYLNLIEDKDQLAGLAEINFQKNFASHSDAKFLSAASFPDLLDQLKHLPQDGSIDRIEIVAHGKAGAFKVGSQTMASPELKALKDARLNFAAPGAELRVISCSLAGGTTFNRSIGENFVKEWGEALLPKGGSVFAATRNILAKKVPEVRFLQRATGLSIVSDLVFQVSPALLKNLPQAKHSFVRVDIIPNSSCGAGFQSLVTRVR